MADKKTDQGQLRCFSELIEGGTVAPLQTEHQLIVFIRGGRRGDSKQRNGNTHKASRSVTCQCRVCLRVTQSHSDRSARKPDQKCGCLTGGMSLAVPLQ